MNSKYLFDAFPASGKRLIHSKIAEKIEILVLICISLAVLLKGWDVTFAQNRNVNLDLLSMIKDVGIAMHDS